MHVNTWAHSSISSMKCEISIKPGVYRLTVCSLHTKCSAFPLKVHGDVSIAFCCLFHASLGFLLTKWACFKKVRRLNSLYVNRNWREMMPSRKMDDVGKATDFRNRKFYNSCKNHLFLGTTQINNVVVNCRITDNDVNIDVCSNTDSF